MNLRERKKLATRQTLMEIAKRMFGEKDFDDVKVEDIAAEANVSNKTFFNYFPSKGRLMEALLIDWLQAVNIWSSQEAPPTDIASAILPPNISAIQDWVIEHRRILQMLLEHTDVFDSIYYSHNSVDSLNALFPPDYRRPRIERVRMGQEAGFIRDDISPRLACDINDYIRIDLLRRWLRTPDELASGEAYRADYKQAIEVLFRGLAPWRGPRAVSRRCR